jgi:hypothetical protein
MVYQQKATVAMSGDHSKAWTECKQTGIKIACKQAQLSAEGDF